jgi:hypothetical protein
VPPSKGIPRNAIRASLGMRPRSSTIKARQKEEGPADQGRYASSFLGIVRLED